MAETYTVLLIAEFPMEMTDEGCRSSAALHDRAKALSEEKARSLGGALLSYEIEGVPD